MEDKVLRFFISQKQSEVSSIAVSSSYAILIECDDTYPWIPILHEGIYLVVKRGRWNRFHLEQTFQDASSIRGFKLVQDKLDTNTTDTFGHAKQRLSIGEPIIRPVFQQGPLDLRKRHIGFSANNIAFEISGHAVGSMSFQELAYECWTTKHAPSSDICFQNFVKKNKL